MDRTAYQKRQDAKLRVRQMTFAALYLALALVLPFLTGQIPQIGSMLCPMHIPALLCGFVCGWPWGLAVGFISPLLRAVLFGMPVLFPTALAMAIEMGVYGTAAGLLYRWMPRFTGRLYVILLAAMVLGRLAWGGAQWMLMGLTGGSFSLELFLTGAVTTALLGIILQLILIPPVVALMAQSGLCLNRPRRDV